MTAGFALILVFILSIYMLIYGERIGEVVRSVMPPGDGTPEDDYPTRVQRAVAGYVRGQLLFSVAMGTGAASGCTSSACSGSSPTARRYAFAFGIFFGLMELIPFVGPVPRRAAADARGAVPGSADRALGRPAVPRAAADRGPRRRAATCSATRCGSTRCS